MRLSGPLLYCAAATRSDDDYGSVCRRTVAHSPAGRCCPRLLLKLDRPGQDRGAGEGSPHPRQAGRVTPASHPPCACRLPRHLIRGIRVCSVRKPRARFPYKMIQMVDSNFNFGYKLCRLDTVCARLQVRSTRGRKIALSLLLMNRAHHASSIIPMNERAREHRGNFAGSRGQSSSCTQVLLHTISARIYDDALAK